ncbi:hypothetical protein SNEBB_005680 [Seison nebaliae]|nr:hypothetical protein SNEBB_005680 [Seison nebaliae]
MNDTVYHFFFPIHEIDINETRMVMEKLPLENKSVTIPSIEDMLMESLVNIHLITIIMPIIYIILMAFGLIISCFVIVTMAIAPLNSTASIRRWSTHILIGNLNLTCLLYVLVIGITNCIEYAKWPSYAFAFMKNWCSWFSYVTNVVEATHQWSIVLLILIHSLHSKGILNYSITNSNVRWWRRCRIVLTVVVLWLVILYASIPIIIFEYDPVRFDYDQSQYVCSIHSEHLTIMKHVSLNVARRYVLFVRLSLIFLLPWFLNFVVVSINYLFGFCYRVQMSSHQNLEGNFLMNHRASKYLTMKFMNWSNVLYNNNNENSTNNVDIDGNYKITNDVEGRGDNRKRRLREKKRRKLKEENSGESNDYVYKRYVSPIIHKYISYVFFLNLILLVPSWIYWFLVHFRSTSDHELNLRHHSVALSLNIIARFLQYLYYISIPLIFYATCQDAKKIFYLCCYGEDNEKAKRTLTDKAKIDMENGRRLTKLVRGNSESELIDFSLSGSTSSNDEIDSTQRRDMITTTTITSSSTPPSSSSKSSSSSSTSSTSNRHRTLSNEKCQTNNHQIFSNDRPKLMRTFFSQNPINLVPYHSMSMNNMSTTGGGTWTGDDMTRITYRPIVGQSLLQLEQMAPLRELKEESQFSNGRLTYVNNYDYCYHHHNNNNNDNNYHHHRHHHHHPQQQQQFHSPRCEMKKMNNEMIMEPQRLWQGNRNAFHHHQFNNTSVISPLRCHSADILERTHC